MVSPSTWQDEELPDPNETESIRNLKVGDPIPNTILGKHGVDSTRYLSEPRAKRCYPKFDSESAKTLKKAIVVEVSEDCITALVYNPTHEDFEIWYLDRK